MPQTRALSVLAVLAALLAVAPAAGAADATLSLQVGAPAAFGAFLPGVDRTYDASTTASVTSTAPNATLTVHDGSGVAPAGHLVNGTSSLAQAMQARAASAVGTGGAFASIGASPLTILSYAGPVSNDGVSIGVRQVIGASEVLEPGAYSKTFTLTLSTTTPCEMSTTATMPVGGSVPASLAALTSGTVSCPEFQFSGGFGAPIDNAALNIAKAGKTVPVKWRVLDSDGNPVSDPESFESVTSTGDACDGGPADAVETYAGESGLQYLGDGLWQFNWKTPKSYAGQCRTLVLTLSDDSTLTADFQFN